MPAARKPRAALVSTFLLPPISTLLIAATAHTAPGPQGVWKSLGPVAPLRTGPAFFDSNRQRMVMFGTSVNPHPWSEGWIWSLDLAGPPSWTLDRALGTLPPAGGDIAMDAARDRGIYFVKTTGAVWLLPLDAAPRWFRFTPRGEASPRSVPSASIYDPVRNQIVWVRGGSAHAGGCDVWTLTCEDGGTWTPWTVSGTPPVSVDRAVYDAAGDRVVLENADMTAAWSLDLGTATWSTIAPSEGFPPSRSAYGLVADPARQRVLHFAGYTSGSYVNETWQLSTTPVDDWLKLTTIGASPQARAGASVVLDPGTDRMVAFGGSYSGYDGSIPLSDLWSLDLASEQWAQLHPVPGRRSGHSAIHDPDGDRMIVFGGSNAAGPPVVWQLRGGAVAVSARPIDATGTPPANRTDAATVYDPVRRRMLVFGGLTTLMKNDLWSLELDGPPAWTDRTPAGTLPAARSAHTLVHDASRDRIVLFGGYTPGRLNDVWVMPLDGSAGWSQIVPSGTPPSTRFGHTAIFDAARDRMVVFGGRSTAPTNDVWALNFSGSPAWQKLNPAGTPPAARSEHTAIHDPLADRMVIYGGAGSSGPEMSDAWALDLASPAWVPLPAGAGNSAHSAIYDPRRDRMVVYGGSRAVNDYYYEVSQLTWQREPTVGVGGEARAEFALRGFAPNPARAGALGVQLALPDAAPAQLELFDLAGRRMWSEDVGARGAGVHHVRIAAGQQLPAGVYLVRLARGAQTLTTRGVVLE